MTKTDFDNGSFLLNVKYFGNRIEIQFNNTPLVIEQNNYASKIVNVYIVYDLDNCQKKSVSNSYTKKLVVCSDL